MAIADDEVLVAMKDIEKNPFCVAKFAGLKGEKFEAIKAKMVKKEINKFSVDKDSYKRLVSHYWTIHSPIL